MASQDLSEGRISYGPKTPVSYATQALFAKQRLAYVQHWKSNVGHAIIVSLAGRVAGLGVEVDGNVVHQRRALWEVAKAGLGHFVLVYELQRKAKTSEEGLLGRDGGDARSRRGSTAQRWHPGLQSWE